MAVNRVTGMYSGLDTESIVSQLVEAKSVKVNTKKKDQMAIKYKQDAWNDLNKKVKSLFSNISNLRFQSSSSTMKTTVSDSSVASVVSKDDAMLASQTLKVNKLAKAGYMTGTEITTTDVEQPVSAAELKVMAAAKADVVGKKDMTLLEEYIAGTDPTDQKSKFTVKIAMDADGQPVVTWEPALNGEGVRTGVRTYTVMGSNVLSNDPKDWTECGEGKEGGFQYFKVSVKMP